MINKNILLETLSTLPHKHCVAFTASCCERLIPNYHAFALMEHWGDSASLQEAEDTIWAFLRGANLDESRIRELIKACKAAAPHSDDFGSIFVGAAINAYAAIVHTLEYCLDEDIKHIAYVIDLATDTIREYLFTVNFPKIGLFAHDFTFDEWIEQAPLMIAELEKQQQDLEALKEHTLLNSDFLADMRQSSGVVGIHPIKRGIVIPHNT
jgi:hypothetical protein